RKAKQQKRIGPKDEAVDPSDRVQKMVMVVPINRQIDKAQDITGEMRKQIDKRLPICTVRHFQFQDHDRDDDGNDAIAECSKTIFSHVLTPRPKVIARRTLLSQSVKKFWSCGQPKSC